MPSAPRPTRRHSLVNMGFPSPSEKQAKVLWFSLTALAIAIFLALLTLMFYGVAWLLDRLTPVLLPLAVAGACIAA